MRINRKPTGTALSVPAGLTYGALISAALTLAGSGVTAKLVDKEVLAWDHVGYAVLVILLMASWAGAAMAAGKIKRRRIAVCMGAGVIYMLLLMSVAALFFGGIYSGVGETGLLILCGSMIAALVGTEKKQRRKHTVMKRPYR